MAPAATTKRTKTRWKTTAATVEIASSNSAAAASTAKAKATKTTTTTKLHGLQSKAIFVINLDQSVSVDDLHELFGLRSTNYLRNNCHIVMDHFSNVDQPFAFATVTAPAHVCEVLLKWHGIVFHGNPLVIEMSKYRFQQSNHFFQPPLQPPPIQRIINNYWKAVNPWRKDIALFADSIPKAMRMKT